MTTTLLERPAESLDSLSLNLRTQQRATERALRKLARLRKKAADEIDRLLSFLDASDDYVMTELETDTSDTGWMGDGEGPDDEDDERELGAPDGMINQEHAWGAQGGSKGTVSFQGSWCYSGAELDTCDDEPSLGSSCIHDQSHWADGNWRDLELDPTE